jgi:hypothetical protein
MADKFIDSLEPRFDNFDVLPHYEWFLVGVGLSKKTILIPRWCLPNCEFFKEDWDK